MAENLTAGAADTPGLTTQELREHEQAFHSFSKLILFAILHIGLVLACMALAFLANIPVLALLIGLGGTAALVMGFLVVT
ncbi:hypothetical protein [Reyranella sp.]|uniref:hypothetical protein n=1 Tax=Reyranella sp. TaxID=1929291 RepID=UPI001213D4B7|nr:hypothetical protein [Reyranella sp.]TAJ82462.1 MAG: hypothetical protein EPO50_27000 [Reyranella sp.]